MTEYFYATLGFDSRTEATKHVSYWSDFCRQSGFRFGHTACEDEWFVAINRLRSTPDNRSLCFYLHTGEWDGFCDFNPDDHNDLIKEVLAGNPSPPLANHVHSPVSQPLATVDWMGLYGEWQRNHQPTVSITSETLQSVIEFYTKTRLARCLREIWYTKEVREGVFFLSEGWSVPRESVFEMSFEDMLRDLWLHFCFGYVEADTGYHVRK
jgi:hypothetical protein